jgi:pimeloyl-ACP methyl ester carboxylesterase
VFQERYIEANGFEIRYLEAGEGSPVIILESSPRRPSAVHETLAQNRRVIALELPGLDHSPANEAPRSAPVLGAEVTQAIAGLVEGRYTLIGASVAVDVALWQALETPDMVEALILISPAAFPSSEGAASDQAPRSSGIPDDAMEQTRLAEVRCPTLIVVGLNDSAAALNTARLYRQGIPNSNLSLVYAAGHDIASDRPEALTTAVCDFVERREAFVVAHRSSIINP